MNLLEQRQELVLLNAALGDEFESALNNDYRGIYQTKAQKDDLDDRIDAAEEALKEFDRAHPEIIAKLRADKSADVARSIAQGV